MKNVYRMCIIFCICVISCAEIGVEVFPEPLIITNGADHVDGLFCDLANDVFYFFDPYRMTVHKYYEWRVKEISYKIEGRHSVAAVIPIQGNNEDVIVAADTYLYRLNWPDYRNPDYTFTHKNASIKELMKVNVKGDHRFNYGKVDRQGRLWLGTAKRKVDHLTDSKHSELYMFNGDDLQNFKKIPINVTYGMTWSKNGHRLYMSAPAQRLVFGYNFDVKTGHIDHERVVFNMTSHHKLKGTPYGLTTDIDDNIWIGLFGGHSIVNVNPRTSEIIKVTNIYTTYVTSLCIGGLYRNVPYVGTSRHYLNESQIKPLSDDDNYSGCVLAASADPKAQPDTKFKMS